MTGQSLQFVAAIAADKPVVARRLIAVVARAVADQKIVPRPAFKHVGAAATAQMVGPFAAQQTVVAVTAQRHIVAVAPLQQIGAGAADEIVRAVIAVERVTRRITRRVGFPAINYRKGQQLHVAGIALDLTHRGRPAPRFPVWQRGIKPEAGHQQIVSRAAPEQIAAATATQHVIPTPSLQPIGTVVAGQGVGLIAPHQMVVADAAQQSIAPTLAGQPVVAFARLENIGAATAEEAVVAA